MKLNQIEPLLLYRMLGKTASERNELYRALIVYGTTLLIIICQIWSYVYFDILKVVQVHSENLAGI